MARKPLPVAPDPFPARLDAYRRALDHFIAVASIAPTQFSASIDPAQEDEPFAPRRGSILDTSGLPIEPAQEDEPFARPLQRALVAAGEGLEGTFLDLDAHDWFTDPRPDPADTDLKSNLRPPSAGP